ncbi:Nonsense-mediated mRNA decay factor SMG8/SMG9 [Dillenia turbinata]|uniref:Nonsense-mediated mRNA decay factor SMG8 n=1 Tax=Dillenia turbinata TaxID=194707 RepID=A0AAN8VUR2_9MAGN
MESKTTIPTSLRVLTRPSSSAPPPSLPQSHSLLLHPNPNPHPPPDQSTLPPPSNGIVVIGFVGRQYDDVSQLANRILDFNVFGSGNLDEYLFSSSKIPELGDELKEWIKRRKLSYYHDEEKGILFLLFSPTWLPSNEAVLGKSEDFDSTVEELEFGDLQGLLFMFSVCHVIVLVQEGSRFDTQILKRFRMLQVAKHALAPSLRPQSTQPPMSRVHSSSSSRTNINVTSSSRSPNRNGAGLNRSASGISLMSGLGSYASLFPGQCTPVTLFVFVDDFSDVQNPSYSVEELGENSSSTQSTILGSVTRPSLPAKGSGSVVVLARPVSKSESGFRKKLQSSLEAQIRFLIKKCRTLTGFETSHSGSRNGGISSSAPLFSLDASRAVVLLDKCTNMKGESLESAIGLVEEVLSRKATSDSLLLESHSQCANKEDLLCIKEFIFRQSDILRGRGGLISNTGSGPAAGVGMVAVAAAAAAAAASAASAKALTAPELPNLGTWLSSSQSILQKILVAKRDCVDDIDVNKRRPRPQQAEVATSKGSDPLDIAVSWLERGKAMNMKFSTLWCQRALPTAKDVYLKGLPAYYSTSQHEDHLEKALYAFCSMVKGPAVQLFVKKLEDECISIWKSGRQLCDAISLTGKPCMHQRHDSETTSSTPGAEVKPHSSGFVFLHACSCGRSRRIRSDPFDFETANVTSCCFPDCDNLLPALELPKVSSTGPIQPSSWSVIRVGGAKYYEPSKGLLQSGFCASQKYLLKWTIFLEKHKNVASVTRSNADRKAESAADLDQKKTHATGLFPKESQNGAETQRETLEIIKPSDKKISFGNFSMRKPFSEVVAELAAADSGFPPLQQRKQPPSGPEKGNKQNTARAANTVKAPTSCNNVIKRSTEDNSSVLGTPNGIIPNAYANRNPFLQIGSYVVPMNVNSGGNTKVNTSLKNVTVYVGFEHECPHGHRFLLTPEHLNELSSLYSNLSSTENQEHEFFGSSKQTGNNSRGKYSRKINGMTFAAANGSKHLDNSEGLQAINLDDGGGAFSLLNRHLPLYMNCPHCRIDKNQKDKTNMKFAGEISQLQRIFLVTPPFPVILLTCPVIQFEASCLPSSVPNREQLLRFSLGCQAILPPESFLTVRLPFVYGAQLADGSMHPLKPFEHQPELTAWMTRGTALQISFKESNSDENLHIQ